MLLWKSIPLYSPLPALSVWRFPASVSSRSIPTACRYSAMASTVSCSLVGRSDDSSPVPLDTGDEKHITRNRTLHPLWIDTDVGFDDLVAIGCCVGGGRVPTEEEQAARTAPRASPRAETTRVVGISTVGDGLVEDSAEGAAVLRKLFPDMKVIVAGTSSKATKETKDPSWLAECRDQLRGFCDSEGIAVRICHQKNNIPDPKRSEDDATAAISAIASLPQSDASIVPDSDDRMDLVCLGPLTNLARWLDEVPSWATDRLHSVYLLGGNLPIEEPEAATTVVPPEFNFARNPSAVHSVLHHPSLRDTMIHVIPQEVCDRRALETSFCAEDPTQKDSNTPKPASAKNIIEEWLQSSIVSSFVNTTGDHHNDMDSATVSSLLSPWMVRLIRTRTFSVYGDPICLYVRDHMDCNSDGNGTTSHLPRIRWKTYTTSSSKEPRLMIDREGRLVLARGPKKEVEDPFPSEHDDKTFRRGVTIRIAHEVELGPIYMDWLTRSLLSQS